MSFRRFFFLKKEHSENDIDVRFNSGSTIVNELLLMNYVNA